MIRLLCIAYSIIMCRTSTPYEEEYKTYAKIHRQMCPSVMSNCPELTNEEAVIGTDEGTPQGLKSPSKCCGYCSCDYDCEHHCCLQHYGDWQTAFTNQYFSEWHTLYSCIWPQYFPVNSTKTNYKKANYFEPVWMISRCASLFKSDRIQELCEQFENTTDIKSILPVTYGFQRHYKNRFCAQCNFEEEESAEHRFWEIEVHCDRSISISYDNLLTAVEENGCNIFYRQPWGVQPIQCRIPGYTVSECNQTGLWPQFNISLSTACSAFTDPFNQTYKNYFCYLCNTNTPVPYSDWSCNDAFDTTTSKDPTFSIRLSLESLEEKRNIELLGCDLESQFPDFKSMVCQDIKCVEERYLATKHVCLPKQDLNRRSCYMLHIKLTAWRERPLSENILKTLSFRKELRNFLLVNVSRNSAREIKVYKHQETSTGDNDATYQYIIAQLTIDYSGYVILNNIVADLDCDTRGLRIAKAVFESCDFALFNPVEDSSASFYVPVMAYSSDSFPLNVEIADKFYTVKIPQNLSNSTCDTKKFTNKLHVCPYIEVWLNNFITRIERDTDVLVIYEGDAQHIFEKWQYEIHGNSLYFCLDDYLPLYDGMAFRWSNDAVGLHYHDQGIVIVSTFLFIAVFGAITQ